MEIEGNWQRPKTKKERKTRADGVVPDLPGEPGDRRRHLGHARLGAKTGRPSQSRVFHEVGAYRSFPRCGCKDRVSTCKAVLDSAHCPVLHTSAINICRFG